MSISHFVCFNTLVQSERSQYRLATLTRNLQQILMTLRKWILLILANIWPFHLQDSHGIYWLHLSSLILYFYFNNPMAFPPVPFTGNSLHFCFHLLLILKENISTLLFNPKATYYFPHTHSCNDLPDVNFVCLSSSVPFIKIYNV